MKKRKLVTVSSTRNTELGIWPNQNSKFGNINILIKKLGYLKPYGISFGWLNYQVISVLEKTQLKLVQCVTTASRYAGPGINYSNSVALRLTWSSNAILHYTFYITRKCTVHRTLIIQIYNGYNSCFCRSLLHSFTIYITEL